MRRGFIEAHQDVFGASIDLLGQQQQGGRRARRSPSGPVPARSSTCAPNAPESRAWSTPASVADAQRARGAAALDDRRLLGRPVGAVDLGRAAGSPAGRSSACRSCRRASSTLVRRRAGLDAPPARARGLLMTDRAQQAPWRELERLLIAPIAKLLPTQPGSRLTIVPHGPLFALVVRRVARCRAGSTCSSVTTCTTCRRSRRWPPWPRRGPRRRRARSWSAIPAASQAEAGAEPLPALPWAQREVAAVRASLGARDDAADRRQATEGRVRARAGRPPRAALRHARRASATRRRSPSYLALPPSRRRRRPALGRRDLRLDLDADLVVLSACRTALGPVEGDGVIGFARAFLSAGARSVVATQWDVSDRVSYDVMRELLRAPGPRPVEEPGPARRAARRPARAARRHDRRRRRRAAGDTAPLGRLRPHRRAVVGGRPDGRPRGIIAA